MFDHPNDLRDPSPWQALYLDQSLPLSDSVKRDFLISCKSRTRQFLLPLLRPVTRITIASFQVLKVFVPRSLTSSRLLHYLIYVGMKLFVSPESNRLILRHFHVGSEILRFIAMNVGGIKFDLKTLRPKTLAEVKNDLFLEHDLNLFNFIIQLNQGLREQKRRLETPERLDFSAITDGDFPIDAMPDGPFNVLDVESAIEFYTPLYQLLLTDSDFWRASHSLQLDETVAIYVTVLLGNSSYLGVVNNRHPLVPLSTLNSGFRLMIHGLASESLHALLVRCKRAQARGEPLPTVLGSYPLA